MPAVRGQSRDGGKMKKRKGRPQLQVRVSDDTLERLRALAMMHGSTAQELIRVGIEDPEVLDAVILALQRMRADATTE